MKSSEHKEENKFRYGRNFWDSVNAAIKGILHTFRYERNMRVHLIAASLVVFMGLYFNMGYLNLILLLFAITFVLITEMINTAIEHLSDIIVKREFHPRIKLAKDIAAGAVFVASINAVIIGYILTVNRIVIHRGHVFAKITESPWHITFLILLACFGCVVLIKYLRGEKNLLKGGMPSGHTAMAFAVWMTVWIITESTLVSLLVFVLAFVVARSRLQDGIHSVWEVIMGGIIGILTSLLVFQLISW